MKYDPINAEQMKHLPAAVSQCLWRLSLSNLPCFSVSHQFPHTPPSDYYEMSVLSQIRTELIEGELQKKPIKTSSYEPAAFPPAI